MERQQCFPESLQKERTGFCDTLCTQLPGLKTLQLLFLSPSLAVATTPLLGFTAPRAPQRVHMCPPASSRAQPALPAWAANKAIWDKLGNLCCRRRRCACVFLSISQVGPEGDGTSSYCGQTKRGHKDTSKSAFLLDCLFHQGQGDNFTVLLNLQHFAFTAALLQHKDLLPKWCRSPFHRPCSPSAVCCTWAGQCDSPNSKAFIACA